ncbi:MAG: hypothetical protein WD226_00310 [Planctomycetota bacterium]
MKQRRIQKPRHSVRRIDFSLEDDFGFDVDQDLERPRFRLDDEDFDDDEEFDAERPRFDRARWEADITARSRHREQLRRRDLNRGLLTPRHRAIDDTFDDE